MLGRLHMALVLAAAFAVGALGLGQGLTTEGGNAYAKRDDSTVELVTVADDDDDDSGSRDSDGGPDDSGTGVSNDATGSGYSAVSRDGELSRDDRTRDRTQDGAGPTRRDWSADSTNDSSRNDSRPDATGASGDGTQSGVTPVSRDRDDSGGDKTRDRTKDGPGSTRDRSAGHTNDQSRNDTR